MTVKDILMDDAEGISNENIMLKEIDSDEHEKRIAWWREARFGMFIHWGLYSLPAGIWKGQQVKAAYAEHLQLHGKIPIKEYEQIAKEFNPIKFSAEEWVRIAKEAGMKYIIITAKHHEGFAMYDSKVSDFNIVEATPFARDPMIELAEVCDREGIKLCFYYSHSMDWHHPDSQGNTLDFPGNIGAYDSLESWVNDDDKSSRYERYLEEKAYPQIRELLTQYGPVGIIWFDCGHKVTDEQGQKFVDLVHGLQPGCLVNRRVRRSGFGDYENTSDNQVSVRISKGDWESIATLNDSWGYKKNDDNWKTPKELIHNLVDVVSANGNFVLNVGPMGDGSIDSKSLQLINEIGKWMKGNCESIYGTVCSPIGKPAWGRCTMKDNKLYLHVFQWPSKGKLIVPGIRNNIDSIYLLEDPSKKMLQFTRLNDFDIAIEITKDPVSNIDTVIVVEYAGEIDANPLKLVVNNEYKNIFAAFDGDIHGKVLKYDTGKKGRDVVTNWTEMEDWISWDFRAENPGAYKVEITYGADNDAEGGEFSLSICGANLQGKVCSTGGWYKFHSYDLGEIIIPKTGEYRIEVKAAAFKGTALMNLKDITLTSLQNN